MLEGQAAAAIPAEERIIVALDCSEERARELAQILEGHARWVKIGMTLYYAAGPDIVREFRDRGFKVFVDLKLHDIPHQIGGAAASLVDVGVDMMTVHASGGHDMMAAAVKSAAEGATEGRPKPIVLAITVLTSTDDAMLADIGVSRGMSEQVEKLALLAKGAGCDGVVCSPKEAAMLRVALGPDAAIVTPGVRPAGSDVGDQKRVATPADAIAAGASYLVIGRPITGADDPAAAFDDIVDSIR